MPGDKKKQVLLLEDETLIAMDLQSLVEDWGYAVVGPAASCSAALDLIKLHHIDVAILDFMVRDGACDTVADELNARGIPWSLSTGLGVNSLEPVYQSVPLLPKPYDASEVRRVLTLLLDAPA
jgi:CheY-like chemotaxis protein